MKTLSIYIKMIIYFLMVSLLPMAAISVLAFYKVNDLVRQDNQRLLRNIAVHTAYLVERELFQRSIEIQAWADLPVVEQGRRGEMTELFNRLIASYPMYDLLMVLDEKKNLVAINTQSRNGAILPVDDLLGNPYPDGAWLNSLAEVKLLFSNYRQSAMLRNLTAGPSDCLNMAMPIYNGQSGFHGYLVAYLNWAYLQDILDVAQASMADDYAGTMFMIEKDTYKLIAHRNTDLYGEKYLLEVDLSEQVEREAAGIFEYNWPVLKTIGYAQIRLRDQMPSLPWLVCVEVANDVIYGEASFLRDLFLLITLLAAFSIVIVVYFISRRFTDPLLKLVDGAQQIAAGNMEVEMPVRGVDEIGILANAFNQMSDALRQRDEELKQSNLELEEANRLKSEFLANMSHELRTPMNSIIGYTTLVLQRSGDIMSDQQRENLIKVRKNALRLLELLNSILDLSKIEAGSMEVDIEEFSLRGLLETCQITIAPLLEERDIELKLDAPEEDLPLKQDRHKLQQIIINLLGNAVKFTEEGYIRTGFQLVGDPGAGGVDKETKGPWARIWVEDTGIGIHEKDWRNIFSEFRQADGSPTRKYGGTGLGLAISKKLAKLLGGDILVSSEPGFGSTFTVVIPQCHKKAEPLVRQESPHELPAEPVGQQGDSGGEAPEQE